VQSLLPVARMPVTVHVSLIVTSLIGSTPPTSSGSPPGKDGSPSRVTSAAAISQLA